MIGEMCSSKAESATEESLLVNDYLVSKVLYTEKKVVEAINKLNIVKEQVLRGFSKASGHK